jgi:hypothetical protein
MFYLPSRVAGLWRQRRWGGFACAVLLWPFLFIFALNNSLGFASVNFADTATARAERETPAVADAKRKADTLTKSREDECKKRGDKCRELEGKEQDALNELRDERKKAGKAADPQVDAAARLTAWVSFRWLQPTADDFSMLRLFLWTLLPQVGGLVLMLARR